MLDSKENNVHIRASRPADIRNTNATVNRWGQDVRIEILRPKLDVVDDDRVYYEIGESYRIAKDSKDDVNYSLQLPVVFDTTNSTTCVSTQRLFRGDRFKAVKLATQSDLDTGDFFGQNVAPNVGGDPLNANDSTESNEFTVERVLGRFFDQGQQEEYYRYEVFESTPYSGTEPVTIPAQAGNQFQIETEPFGANPFGSWAGVKRGYVYVHKEHYV